MAYPFTNLVFEGGGVKGVAYGGVLEVLDQQGILNQIQNVAGTMEILSATSRDLSLNTAGTKDKSFLNSCRAR